jgi:hypothetical protein
MQRRKDARLVLGFASLFYAEAGVLPHFEKRFYCSFSSPAVDVAAHRAVAIGDVEIHSRRFQCIAVMSCLGVFFCVLLGLMSTLLKKNPHGFAFSACLVWLVFGE